MIGYVLNGRAVTREEWLAGAPGITPGRPPAILTDSVFLAGMSYRQAEDFNRNGAVANVYRQEAAEQGVDTTGAVYLGQLAEYPGDPKAWVRGRGDVHKVCEERGWGCTGAVQVKGERIASEPVDVAADLVDERVLDNIESDPDLRRKPLGELRHDAKEQLKPKKKAPVK